MTITILEDVDPCRVHDIVTASLQGKGTRGSIIRDHQARPIVVELIGATPQELERLRLALRQPDAMPALPFGMSAAGLPGFGEE